jgi:hypothetical protein
MQALRKVISLFIVLTGLAAHPLSTFSAETNAVAANRQLPTELENFLTNADDFTLFSLNPDPDFEHKSTNTFQNHVILGQIKIVKMTTRITLITALNDGISAENENVPPGVGVLLPDCFNPRHGIRVKNGDETVELLICFECAQIQVHSSKGKSWFFMTTKKPAAIFNFVLKKKWRAAA